MTRLRPILRKILLVVFAILLPLSLLTGWANATIYDSGTFSERSVDLLNSPAVRREMANRITEQLARDGNAQAVNFRPAFQLAIEAVIDTDTFKSIFRTAVRRTHQGLIVNSGSGEGGTGLDLSDSVSIITSTLSLPQDAKPSDAQSGSLGNSLTDVTNTVGQWGLWELQDTSSTFFVVGLLGSFLAGAGAIALAEDRRRTVKRLGVITIGAGLFLFVLVSVIGFVVGARIDDPQLSAAVQGAIARGLADLSSIGLWTAGYGVVVMASAAAMGENAKRVTPASSVQWVSGWVDARRSSTRGTIFLGAVGIAAGLTLVANPGFWVQASVVLGGLWLVYFGITEILRLLRSAAVDPKVHSTKQARVRRYVALGTMAAVLLAAVTIGGVSVTRRAAAKAQAAGQETCNGEASLCDLPLNAAVFPGTHNSMSTALYPGWLFAEQIDTIGGQLNSGIRALLIDTHYGVPSSAVLPGSETPIVLTDRAAELQQPVGEDIDPAVAAKAQQLSQAAPPLANAKREIYLCHNFCELGAVKFSSVLAEIKTFVDSHPDDVVMTIIQDATTPADTAAAIEAAGLGDKVWTLDPNQPLPTLGEMIEAGKTLLVFAEEGGDGAPAWYQEAYDWFQETRYKWASTDEMTCAPNRGYSDAPLFLVNHWVAKSPPDPSSAKQVNSTEVLTERLQQCARERGMVPNIIATDFGETGDVVAVARDLNESLLAEIESVRAQARGQVGDQAADADVGGTVTTGGTSATPTFGVTTTFSSLTGGDPAVFCASVGPAVEVGASWALAAAFSIGDGQGLADLAYGPSAARALDAAIAVAPQEVADRLSVAADRARVTVAVLEGLGISDDQIEEVAGSTSALLADPNADPSLVQQQIVAQIAGMLGTGGGDELQAAAKTFTTENPASLDLFDFGVVTDEVARASGYDCLIT